MGALRIAEMAQRHLTHYCEPEVWTNDKFQSQDTPIESLFRLLDEFQFALFVALPEDFAVKGGSEHHTLRDNVLFEMGLFLGRLGRGRVFCIAPRSTDGPRLHLPTDLTGIQPSQYDDTAVNTQAAVSASLLELKEALRQFQQNRVIFDASQGLAPDHLVNKGGRRHDRNGNAISGYGQANYKLTNEALEITRTNHDGIWEIEVRPAGPSIPTVARTTRAERQFLISFQARVTGSSHILRCVSIDASNWAWIDNRFFSVSSSDWNAFGAHLRAPLNLDILFRLQDEIDSPPDGTLYVRNVAVVDVS